VHVTRGTQSARLSAVTQVDAAAGAEYAIRWDWRSSRLPHLEIGTAGIRADVIHTTWQPVNLVPAELAAALADRLQRDGWTVTPRHLAAV
jgi:hypothetical protein